MKNFMKVIVVTLLITLSTLYAGDGHNHSHDGHSHDTHEYSHGYEALKNEIGKKTVEEIARKEVKRLVLERKIHSSWKTVPISKIGKTHYSDTTDWKVGFTNLKIKNKKRQTLYIFVSVRGKVTGANYTGN